MILSQEQWMELRAFKALAEAGATWAEIARETGYDWRTVKRYLSADAGSSPPAPAKRGPGPRKTDPYAHLIDAWLRAQPKLKASVIWERLVNEHGFDGHYQRVKVYVRENRERLVGDAAGPVGLHRRFEVLAGAQAQVDWGDEGELQTPAGPLHAYSFHMTLSYSRDPFCCYVASQDLGSFWDCHRRAFAHFGGVPAPSSMPGPRPWCTAMWVVGRPPRCIPRRWPSPPTTGSPSGWPPRAGPRPKDGSSDRSSWSEATSSVAGVRFPG
jgi:transposase